MEKELLDKFEELMNSWKSDRDSGFINEDQFNKLSAGLTESFKVSVGDPLAELTAELKIQNEQNKIVKAATEILNPRNSYKAFLTEIQKSAPEDEQRSLGFNVMVRDLYNKFTGKINDEGMNRLKAYYDIQKNALQTEGTNSTGGFLVPTPTLGLIMDDLRESGLFFSETTMYTINGKDATIPTLTTHATPANVAEGAEKAVSNLVFGSATLTLKKYACLIPFTDELMQDAIVDLEALVRDLAKEWYGTVLDNILFDGDAAINGLADLTTTFVTLGAGLLSNREYTLDDIISVIGAMRSVDLVNAKFYMSPSVWAHMHSLKGTTNDHYHLSLNEFQTKTLLGFPVVLTDSLPASAVADSASQKFLVFGNLKKVIVGVKNGMTIDVASSNVASFNDGGTERSAFQDNLTVVRLEKRVAMTVPFPLRIVQLRTAAA